MPSYITLSQAFTINKKRLNNVVNQHHSAFRIYSNYCFTVGYLMPSCSR